MISTRIVKLSLAAGVAMAVAISAFTPTKPISAKELRLASFTPARSSQDRSVLIPWAKEVAKVSGGSLTVKVFSGGALGKGPVGQFKRAVDGVADIAWGLPGFTASVFPRTGIIEFPFVAGDGIDGVNKLYKSIGLLSPEWSKVKLLTLWVSEPLFLIMKKNPVRSTSDLKGMKIRTPSTWQAAVIKALGGSPVAMPISGVYNALNQDVIDGVLTGPIGAQSFKLTELGKYFTTGIPFGRLPFFIAMNQGSWNGLSAEHKQVLEATTGRSMGHKATLGHIREGNVVINALKKDPKKTFIEISGPDRKKASKVMAGVRDKLIADLDKKGIPASAILAKMLAK
ncbi:MAG: TRAP transporter substrate-binding protein [Rhodospirillaceae bacterium]|jgi:TRAP-type C4-dicarboxylate transport system substrate-binding protein|nr:TRAP transporter substrate-binding protein [Rhodospirillaceae bacterium]MBT3883948.1 TRAP transporter substrate-binding protein [Rhodospirillaceae bacterium]MBT4117706.1 TRAP transporter substrate-binding protein [Rhodospirillaceae bacterium]MBT4674463.1 TRAP transporter substrate-binding protein [Rhodospirillaceae bacterium]MBT4751155.1 TRAP transporter substrate-binding protein [Rhodospirillaceae bacterium]